MGHEGSAHRGGVAGRRAARASASVCSVKGGSAAPAAPASPALPASPASTSSSSPSGLCPEEASCGVRGPGAHPHSSARAAISRSRAAS